MKTVKSNVRSSLCQRKGLILMRLFDPEKGLRMVEFRHLNPDLASYAETCN